MSVVYVDTETTGLKRPWTAGGRRIWEVALIDGEHEHQFFVDTEMGDADPFALSIGGYFKRHPHGVRLATGSSGGYANELTRGSDCVPRIGSLVSERQAALFISAVTHGKHLMGAVGSFDEEGFAHLLWEQGVPPAWHYHVIDIEAMAVGYLGATVGPGDPGDVRRMLNPPWRSDDLAKLCGVEPPSDADRHTALGDARWVKRWHEALIGGE